LKGARDVKYRLLIHRDLYNTSLLLAALASLQSPAHVAVKASSSITRHVPRLIVGGKMLAFDVRDQSFSVCLETLEHADIYFKRSYYEPDLAPIPQVLRRKIRPMGLNYPMKTRGSAALVARMVLRRPFSAYKLRASLRRFVVLADAESFERSPETKADPVVFFQTRVWSSSEVIGDDVAAVNESRVATVRLLRKRFGDRFRGGLVPTEFARREYPDLVTTEPYVHSAYARSSRTTLIGVYTRGLFDSLAFKLPEYLAGSKCIVSERLRNTLPVPLQEGHNLLQFDTTEECAELCDTLLSNPQLCREMQAANWEYYRRNVRFDQRVGQWLSVL
jgi:hypothetical protein